MFVDPNWTYNEVITFAEALKNQYEEILASFVWQENVAKIKFMWEFKQQIYALKFSEWRRDKIWAYLNGDEDLLTITKYIPKCEIDKNDVK